MDTSMALWMQALKSFHCCGLTHLDPLREALALNWNVLEAMRIELEAVRHPCWASYTGGM